MVCKWCAMLKSLVRRIMRRHQHADTQTMNITPGTTWDQFHGIMGSDSKPEIINVWCNCNSDRCVHSW